MTIEDSTVMSRVVTPNDLNSESICTPADLLLLCEEEEEQQQQQEQEEEEEEEDDILSVEEQEEEEEDVTLLKTPIWRQVSQWCRVRRRYIAYFCLLLNSYTEMSARFGMPIAMIGGMVKKDCNDPHDEGTFCWSDETQALVLGAYFYGYSAQCITTFVARRFTGFTTTYRFWLITSAAIQFCFPTFAAMSTTLVIVTEAIRGLLAGIMMAYNFDYLSKFAVGGESKILISLNGVANFIGNGTGGLLAGLITPILGWQYYYYYLGIVYIVGLVLNLIFIHESPEKSWYLSAEEKSIMAKDNKTCQSSSNPPEDDLSKDEQSSSMKSIFCRAYLPAFCVYMGAYILAYYGILNVLPFYLNKVLGADPLFISYINVSLCLLMAFCTLAFSFIFQRLDKLFTWLECRMIFTLVPMILQIAFFIGLSFNTSITGGIILLTLSAIAASTLFSGSIYTINYEIDPKNSAILFSIINSISQTSGFLGPILMAAITYTDPLTPDYDVVYRERWSYFFYVVAATAASGVVTILLAYFIKPDEWVNRDSGKECE